PDLATAAPDLATPTALSVMVLDNKFDPATVSIKVNGTITWNWGGAVIHTVTSGTAPTPDGTFDSGAAQSTGSFMHTFAAAGTVPYFCKVHGAMMTGTVIVVP